MAPKHCQLRQLSRCFAIASCVLRILRQFLSCSGMRLQCRRSDLCLSWTLHDALHLALISMAIALRLHLSTLLVLVPTASSQAMASHVRSSLQQVIDTLRWIHTTDEEQLSVALSRLPLMERRDFLSRIQDAVYTSHSHVTHTSAAEATYLDSPAFRQEPTLHSSRNWADMSSDPLQQSTDPSTTWQSDTQQPGAAASSDPVETLNRAREANAGQEKKLGHCNVQQLALIGCREPCATCGVSQCGYCSENPLDSHFQRSDTVHSCKECHKRKKEQSRPKPSSRDEAGHGWGSDSWGTGWDGGWHGGWGQRSW